jgi:hypothetical protein
MAFFMLKSCNDFAMTMITKTVSTVNYNNQIDYVYYYLFLLCTHDDEDNKSQAVPATYTKCSSYNRYV